MTRSVAVPQRLPRSRDLHHRRVALQEQEAGPGLPVTAGPRGELEGGGVIGGGGSEGGGKSGITPPRNQRGFDVSSRRSRYLAVSRRLV